MSTPALSDLMREAAINMAYAAATRRLLAQAAPGQPIPKGMEPEKPPPTKEG